MGARLGHLLGPSRPHLGSDVRAEDVRAAAEASINAELRMWRALGQGLWCWVAGLGTLVGDLWRPSRPGLSRPGLAADLRTAVAASIEAEVRRWRPVGRSLWAWVAGFGDLCVLSQPACLPPLVRPHRGGGASWLSSPLLDTLRAWLEGICKLCDLSQPALQPPFARLHRRGGASWPSSPLLKTLRAWWVGIYELCDLSQPA